MKKVLGILILFVGTSCNQNLLDDPQRNSKSFEQMPIRGILIENKINRGINYTNPEGVDLSIRYIPISIFNDSTVSIHIQLEFSTEYDYPDPGSDEQFKLVTLPARWAIDGVDISDSMIDELPNYIQNPVLNQIIRPGEKLELAIGSVYPRPAKSSGVLPRMLFFKNDSNSVEGCTWLGNENQSLPSWNSLKLKVIFGDECRIFPCGRISFLDRSIKRE